MRKGGWTRVGYLNMSESGATCPTGLTKKQLYNIDHGVCGQPTTYDTGCVSTTFSLVGMTYHKICGQVRGYEYNSPDAFGYKHFGKNEGIDTYYVDGISITHGQNPRQHIQTYADGHSGNPARCPCETPSTSENPPPPSFVGIITTVKQVMTSSGMEMIVQVLKLPVVLTPNSLGSIEYLKVNFKMILS